MIICQSCGMGIEEDEDFATESDGSKNEEYCIHCYKNGKFTFNGSFEEFVEKQIDVSTRMMGISPTEAENLAREKLPILNRWKGQTEEEDDDEFDF